MKCPVCDSELNPAVEGLYDDRYGYDGLFTLLRCQHCDHISLECEFTASQLTDLYTNYYPRSSFDISQYKPSIEERGCRAWLRGWKSAAFRWVPKNVRVLDIGCGFGESLGYHAARGCEAYGVETDNNIRRVAEAFGFRVHIGLFDPGLYEPNFFDYVTMDQVVEHIADPISTLRGVARILKPGGVALVSTPNANGWGARVFGRRWINWHSPYHQQFFSQCSMHLAAKSAGLVLKEVRTLTSSEWLSYQWVHLVLYPSRGEPSRFWSPTGKEKTLLARVAIKLLDLLHKTQLNDLITRFFDTIGMGDNFVFTLTKPRLEQ